MSENAVVRIKRGLSRDKTQEVFVSRSLEAKPVKKALLYFLQIHFWSPCEQSLFYLLFFNGQETEKEALHKSALTFEVAVAPTLGLVIPVYCRQTGFSSASINFYKKPMVEIEPTVKNGGEITDRLYPRDMCMAWVRNCILATR